MPEIKGLYPFQTGFLGDLEQWEPSLHSNGREWILSYECPTCTRPQVLHIQAGGWETPVVDEDEDATGQSSVANETTPEVRRWERRRATEDIVHELQSEITTQLWCHSCQKGVDITLTE